MSFKDTLTKWQGATEAGRITDARRRAQGHGASATQRALYRVDLLESPGIIIELIQLSMHWENTTSVANSWLYSSAARKAAFPPLEP